MMTLPLCEAFCTCPTGRCLHSGSQDKRKGGGTGQRRFNCSIESMVKYNKEYTVYDSFYCSNCL